MVATVVLRVLPVTLVAVGGGVEVGVRLCLRAAVLQHQMGRLEHPVYRHQQQYAQRGDQSIGTRLPAGSTSHGRARIAASRGPYGRPGP